MISGAFFFIIVFMVLLQWIWIYRCVTGAHRGKTSSLQHTHGKLNLGRKGAARPRPKEHPHQKCKNITVNTSVLS